VEIHASGQNTRRTRQFVFVEWVTLPFEEVIRPEFAQRHGLADIMADHHKVALLLGGGAV
jgi:hypothetical protein